jgi:putative toxin-antitoxin system antitoxin component (TIGR02293 family)
MQPGIAGVAQMPRAQAKTRRPRKPAAGFAEEVHSFNHEDVVRGIAATTVKHLIDNGTLTAKQVYRVIPMRTFNRRLAQGESLKVSESDAIARLLRVTEFARRIFRDDEFARQYLNLPNPVLKNQIPIEMAVTDAGAREVEYALSRFAHGDYI